MTASPDDRDPFDPTAPDFGTPAPHLTVTAEIPPSIDQCPGLTPFEPPCYDDPTFGEVAE